jgi:hypothetical protein
MSSSAAVFTQKSLRHRRPLALSLGPAGSAAATLGSAAAILGGGLDLSHLSDLSDLSHANLQIQSAHGFHLRMEGAAAGGGMNLDVT